MVLLFIYQGVFVWYIIYTLHLLGTEDINILIIGMMPITRVLKKRLLSVVT